MHDRLMTYLMKRWGGFWFQKLLLLFIVLPAALFTVVAGYGKHSRHLVSRHKVDTAADTLRLLSVPGGNYLTYAGFGQAVNRLDFAGNAVTVALDSKDSETYQKGVKLLDDIDRAMKQELPKMRVKEQLLVCPPAQ